MKVVLAPIESIIPYELNAKKHPAEQIEKLAKEITDIGWTQPIVVDHDGVIVSGHGRLLAAQKLGLAKVPVNRLPEGLSAERVRAHRLFDNKVAETGWDRQLLQAEIASLAMLNDFDSTWTGFDDTEWNALATLPEDKPARPDAEGAQELDRGSFTKFSHECPKCGFSWE